MDFKIIDYQNMMSGNPTIKTIFAFWLLLKLYMKNNLKHQSFLFSTTSL